MKGSRICTVPPYCPRVTGQDRTGQDSIGVFAPVDGTISEAGASADVQLLYCTVLLRPGIIASKSK